MSRIINPEDKEIWGRQFNVVLTPITETLHVYADSVQDALDYAVDYAEEQGWEGIFLSEEEQSDWCPDDIAFAGNHGRALLSHLISIMDVTGDDWRSP